MNINVTSGSSNKVDGIAIAKSFSPLHIGPVVDSDGLLFKTVEGYWQGNKVYQELGHLDGKGRTTRAWEVFRREQAALSKGVRHPACLRTEEVLSVDHRGGETSTNTSLQYVQSMMERCWAILRVTRRHLLPNTIG